MLLKIMKKTFWNGVTEIQYWKHSSLKSNKNTDRQHSDVMITLYTQELTKNLYIPWFSYECQHYGTRVVVTWFCKTSGSVAWGFLLPLCHFGWSTYLCYNTNSIRNLYTLNEQLFHYAFPPGHSNEAFLREHLKFILQYMEFLMIVLIQAFTFYRGSMIVAKVF